MDEALIYVSVISGLFTLAAIMLMNMMWFKKENFKYGLAFQKKKHDLEFKKLARDLGVSSSPSKNSPGPSSQGGITLSPEMLQTLVKTFTGGEGAYEEEIPTGEGSPIEGLIKWGLENPDNPIVKGFMQGMQKATTGQRAGGEETFL